MGKALLGKLSCMGTGLVERSCSYTEGTTTFFVASLEKKHRRNKDAAIHYDSIRLKTVFVPPVQLLSQA